jgi:hypothetical protein
MKRKKAPEGVNPVENMASSDEEGA